MVSADANGMVLSIGTSLVGGPVFISINGVHLSRIGGAPQFHGPSLSSTGLVEIWHARDPFLRACWHIFTPRQQQSRTNGRAGSQLVECYWDCHASFVRLATDYPVTHWSGASRPVRFGTHFNFGGTTLVCPDQIRQSTHFFGIELILEIWFEWTVFSVLQHLDSMHWRLSMAAVGMLVSHWMYLLAATLEVWVLYSRSPPLARRFSGSDVGSSQEAAKPQDSLVRKQTDNQAQSLQRDECGNENSSLFGPDGRGRTDDFSGLTV